MTVSGENDILYLANNKSSATTQLVSQIILSGGTTLSYGYDAEDRITSVVETYTVDDTPVTNTTLYTYDALGQLSPFHLLVLILLAGLALGQIRIRKIPLGIAGVLFAAILVGTFVKLFVSATPTETLSNTQATMKTFSTLGSSLLVSIIGLQLVG